MDSIDTLIALSPLDGRYAPKLEALRPIFSEFGLIHRRVLSRFLAVALCDARYPQARPDPGMNAPG